MGEETHLQKDNLEDAAVVPAGRIIHNIRLW